MYLNNFLGTFEASAVNSKIVSAPLSGIYKTAGASFGALRMPRPGKVEL